MYHMIGSIITFIVLSAVFVYVASKSKMPAKRKMAVMLLLIVVLFATLGNDCEETESAKDAFKAASDMSCEQCQNVVDSINRAADDAGLPNNVSGEIYKAVTSP